MEEKSVLTFSAPKILHQTYKSKDLPEPLATYQQKWLDMCPEYLYKFYDDNDLRNVVASEFPEYLQFYDSMTEIIERVDFARYAILYSYGGVYADLDTVPLKPLDVWLEKGQVVLGREPLEHSRQIYNRDVVLCNAFMISPPREQYWKDLMEYIKNKYEPYNNAVYTTGPMIMTKMYEEMPQSYSNVLITDPCVFFPITNTEYSQKEQNGFKHVSASCDINDAYVAHLWENTWTPGSIFSDPRFKNPKNWIMALSALAIIIIFLFIMKRRLIR